MNISQLPILLIVVPLIAAPLCVLIGNRKAVYAFSLVVAWATFAMALLLVNDVSVNGPIRYEIGGWSPNYGIEYVVDPLSGFVMTFITGIAAIVLTYAGPGMNREIPKSHQYLFCPMYLLCMTGLLGMCITGDLFNLFVFLEISSLSSYALIALGRTRRAPLAAFQYLVAGTIGATFLLIGIGLVYQMTGTLNMALIAEKLRQLQTVDHGEWTGSRTMLVAFAFLTVGLAIKMAVFPLHSWLPGAYTHAPTPVTCFIAATSTKVSVYAFIRVTYLIFSPQFAFGVLPLSQAMMAFALVGIFVASIAAIYQTDVKRLLAWSSISQIGYMLLGISMVSQWGLSAGIVHMFNHAIIKGGLFMVVGCFALRIGSCQLVDLRGAARTMPLTSMAWVVGGLGLIGVPFTAGFVSKWMLLTGALEQEEMIVAGLMLLSSLLALVYVWRVVETLYFYEPSAKVASVREAPSVMVATTWIVIGATIVFGIWTEWPTSMARSAAEILLPGGGL